MIKNDINTVFKLSDENFVLGDIRVFSTLY